jgi:hypothetical protein
MAISRVPGYSLLANLDRQGTDLSLTSSGSTLQYWDVTNYRIGINTTAPLEPLHVEGNIFVANGNVYTSGNLTYTLGTVTNQWQTIYVGNVEAGNVNISGTINIGGNISITGNTTGGIIRADELYDSNNRVLTEATTITVIGDVQGNGTYSNVSVTLTNTAISAGTYGSNISIPQIVFDEKGRAVSAANITLNRVGNVNINDTTISSPSDIILQSNIADLRVTGNITANSIILQSSVDISEIYENGVRVLTQNSNFTVTGDAQGSGTYSNISIVLANTTVSAGTYGGADQSAQFTVNQKGQIIAASNVVISVNQIGNLLVSGTKLYSNSGDIELASAGNIILTSANGYISANNAVLSNLASPLSNNDAVTLAYLNTALSGVSNSVTADDSSIVIVDDGVDPGVINLTVDGVNVANIFVDRVEFYVSTNIGNLRIDNQTISSNGNIILDALGSGTVQFAGSDAIWLPVGEDAQRPENAEEGYFRYNSDRNNIEFFDGTSWNVPGDSSISSQLITPDGVSNTFVLTSNTSTAGTMVSINGVLQRPYTTYNVFGTNLQFSETPLPTDIIEVRTIATGAAITITSLVRGSISVSLDDSNVNVNGNLVLSEPLAVQYGGTGANTANTALQNLLPISTNYGYVLTTDGTGGYFFAEGTPGPAGTFDTTYETLAKNVNAYPYVINRTGSTITNIVYTVGGNTITKSFTYNGSGLLESVAIYGIPLGSTVYTKNLSYSGSQISGVSYSIL